MRLNALTIEVGHRRRRPVDASERPQVVDIEQKTPVTGPAQPVEMDQTGLDVGSIRVGDLFQRVGTRRRVVQLARRVLLLPVDRGKFLDFDLPVEFELSQLHQQLALLRDERLGLAL